MLIPLSEVCHDVCRVVVAVDSTYRIKVPFVNTEWCIQGFRDALDRILHNPGLVGQLSEGALRRASELSWGAKVKDIADAYAKYTLSG